MFAHYPWHCHKSHLAGRAPASMGREDGRTTKKPKAIETFRPDPEYRLRHTLAQHASGAVVEKRPLGCGLS